MGKVIFLKLVKESECWKWRFDLKGILEICIGFVILKYIKNYYIKKKKDLFF